MKFTSFCRSALLVSVASLGLIAFASAEEAIQAVDPVARTKQVMVASPKQILEMRRDIQDNSAARQAPLVGDYEPEISQEVLDLEEMFQITQEPDQQAPKVFISRFQSTAISFIDAYGNPWPIRKVSSFLKGQVLIEKAIPASEEAKEGKEGEDAEADMKDPQAGSITLTALKHGVVGNITVYLYKLATPISINLVGKPSMYHRMATMRVEDAGPQTDPSVLNNKDGVVVGTEADGDLNNALYGVSPLGSETMVVQGAEGKAWIKGDFLYLQTPVAVFSPEILRASHGNGKFRAYKLPKTTTVMGTNTEGKTVTVKIMRHPSTAIMEQNSLKGSSK